MSNLGFAATPDSHKAFISPNRLSKLGNQQARPYRAGLLMRAGLPCGWLALISPASHPPRVSCGSGQRHRGAGLSTIGMFITIEGLAAYHSFLCAGICGERNERRGKQ